MYDFRFGLAKPHRSKRPVSMPTLVVELLRAHRAQQAAAWLQVGAVWTDLDLVRRASGSVFERALRPGHAEVPLRPAINVAGRFEGAKQPSRQSVKG